MKIRWSRWKIALRVPLMNMLRRCFNTFSMKNSARWRRFASPQRGCYVTRSASCFLSARPSRRR